MPNTARLYTPAEAAAVSGMGVKAVHNVIDKRFVDVPGKPAKPMKAAKPVKGAPRRERRYLTADDLVRLRLEYGLAGRLPVERRLSVFRELAANPALKMVKADELLIVDVSEARRQVADRVRDLEEAERSIERSKDVMGGEPVFKGTRIPVYSLVAMMAAGASDADILEGHSRLDARMLDLARLWVAAHPRRGRPKRLADIGFKLKSTSRRRLNADPRRDGTPGRSAE